MLNFREVAKEASLLSILMEEREKMSMVQLTKKFPGGVTVVAVDMIPDKDGVMYPVFNFKEDSKVFCNGGKAFAKIVLSWLNSYDNDVHMLNHDLAESGGVKMKFGYTKLDNGNDFVTVDVL